MCPRDDRLHDHRHRSSCALLLYWWGGARTSEEKFAQSTDKRGGEGYGLGEARTGVLPGRTIIWWYRCERTCISVSLAQGDAINNHRQL